MTKNPLKDVRVRRAMSMAIDRQSLVTRVMQGQAILASQFMPTGLPGTSTKLEPVAFDLVGARKLLAEAGYPDGFGIVMNSTNDRYPNDAKVNQAVAQMWTRLGLKTSVATWPKSVFSRAPRRGFQRSARRQFQLDRRAAVPAAERSGYRSSGVWDRWIKLWPLFQSGAGYHAGKSFRDNGRRCAQWPSGAGLRIRFWRPGRRHSHAFSHNLLGHA